MDDKKQRIRELEKEYLKLSRKEVRLIRKQQNYLIDTSQKRKKLNAVMKKIEDELSEVMYSHHFRYRLEVGASCSIQLLL